MSHQTVVLLGELLMIFGLGWAFFSIVGRLRRRR